MVTKQIDVAVIGNIIKETIIFPDQSIGPVLGSPCAYSSLIMAKLGLKVGAVTYYGNDFPAGLIDELRLVDQSGFIEYAYTTEDHLIYWADGGKNVEYYKTAPVLQYNNIPAAYLEAQLFFICPMNYEVSIELCERLSQSGKTLMIDLGGFGGTTVYNRFKVGTLRGDHYINSLCQAAQIIKVSEEDLLHIMPGISVQQAAQGLLERGAEIVTITLGDRGTLYQTRETRARIVEAFPVRSAVNELNVIGAGDAFAAGFIVSYLKTDNLHEAVRFGNAVASLMIEKPGTCTEARMPAYEVAELRVKGII